MISLSKSFNEHTETQDQWFKRNDAVAQATMREARVWYMPPYVAQAEPGYISPPDTMTMVIEAISSVCGLSPKTILKGKYYHHKHARDIAFWILRRKYEFTFPTLGHVFKVNHTTAFSAVNRVNSKTVRYMDWIEPALVKLGIE